MGLAESDPERVHAHGGELQCVLWNLSAWGVPVCSLLGGSMFEFLMPTLVLNEQDDSPQGLGANNRIAVEAQIDFALNEKRYPVWGISPCAIPDVPQG